MAVNVGLLIKICQLPGSVARWQHGSQISSTTFIKSEITNLLKIKQPLKREKIKLRFRILGILEIF